VWYFAQHTANTETTGDISLKTDTPIFGLGQSALDYIGMIEAYPPPDVKCEFTNMVIQGGGVVATALVALRRWGLPCYFAGVAGDDAFGATIADSLRAEGIDTGGLVIRGGCASQFAFIVCEPGTGRRTIFWRRPTGIPLQPDELDLDVLRRSGALHTDGLFTEASLFACRKAKEAGIPVVVDAGTLREGMLKMVPLSDCFIVSENFSQAMAEDPRETCRILSGMGAGFVGVTLGEKGYIALVDGRLIQRPAYPVRAIDTTGCGDVFHAGVTYGIVHGWDVEKCLDLGAWAAAQVSTQMGGRKGIPAYRELKEGGYGRD
jgi:ribokinase